MNDNLLDRKNDNPKIAEKHINRYVLDLQRHFNLSDAQLVKILNNCISTYKKKDTSKKWWQFFQKSVK